MKKFLITGGSGFIGTNLICQLKKKYDIKILNIDIESPKLMEHVDIWKKIDLLDKNSLYNAIINFSPDYVIHLAARTDLNGKKLDDYAANIEGVSNLLDCIEDVSNLKRVIFTSSMYVCEPGYSPKNFDDYAPHTLYGESKVITEKIIKDRNLQYTWTIIRPTSIWGPWFGEPYNRFFHIVLHHMYFHMGKRACKKTYGYIDNAIYQIMSIIDTPEERVAQKIFYIGDYEPYDISEWANEIANYSEITIPYIPYFCFKLMAWLGDFLKLFGVNFPMTSFRLHNMTTDNVHNLNPIKELAPDLPMTRVEGTKATLEWIHKYEK